MTVSIEERLRSHFAEQAAREDLGEPDPQAVIARSPAAPRPTEQGRRRAGRPGRPLRLAVVGGLAAACLLAVVAAVATRGGDGGQVDIAQEPTTSDTGAGPSTTVPGPGTTPVPEPPTTSVAGTAASSRSVVVAPLGVMGWWDGQHWVDQITAEPAPLQGGEEYQVLRVGASEVLTVAGPAPVELACTAVDMPVVELSAFDPPTEAAIGVTGVADIQPRPVTVLDPAGYRDAAVAALASIGITDPQAKPRQVVRADLDGDGSDEVLFTVERVADRETLRPVEGDYSAVFLRRVVPGGVETVVVEQDLAHTAPGEIAFIDVHDVGAIADLNGDGRMEVVIDTNYYEGGGTTAYELTTGGQLQPVLGVGCGA